VTAPDLSSGLEELAGLISFRVGAWHDFGYAEPPAPYCKPIPPLGERSAEAIKAGHAAIESVDELVRQLYALREQLVGELREDEDKRGARVDAMLRAARQAAAGAPDGRAAEVIPGTVQKACRCGWRGPVRPCSEFALTKQDSDGHECTASEDIPGGAW
jgi:hypothetical protein